MKGWKNIFYRYRNQNQTGIAIIILDKLEFMTEVQKKGQKINNQGTIVCYFAECIYQL